MIIGGLQRFSLIDYPGKMCAVLFTRGCNFRCRYCHNPELVIPRRYSPEVPLAGILAFLHTRQGKLDAVCITGGEPTQQSGLEELIRQLKQMQFLVKLDTNGSAPEILAPLLGSGLLDYVAMDIKAPPAAYEKVTGRPIAAGQIQKSISLLRNSDIEYEFRTTVVKQLTSKQDLVDIGMAIRGARRYFLQQFRPAKVSDPALRATPSYTNAELAAMAKMLKGYVQECRIR